PPPAAFTGPPDGTSDYPILGEIRGAGLSRTEVAAKIKESIIAKNLLKDPIVPVEFMNASISILGDVAHPGEYAIDRDNLNIFQALSKAGDLNITGMRENVLVVREEFGQDIAYRLDLTNTQALMQSPAFYLQQNDVVYVEPNDTKKRQANANGNTVLTPTFWMSVVSLLTTISVLIFK
ncbi:MAG: polysaccharide biosynthesis/export family protein, partial [Paramuribaculum sp.]